jgi:hypothetical protein
VCSDVRHKEETVVVVELTLLQKQYYRATFKVQYAASCTRILYHSRRIMPL